MLYTCNKTEIPPNPNKKADKMILIEMALQEIIDICFTPLVSSIIPAKRAVEKRPSEIPNKFKIGDKSLLPKARKCVSDKIDKMTLNKTTKPPTIITDFTAEKILWLSTSPKLEKETISVLEVEKLFSEAFSFLFQKRNKNPTVKQERICVTKSNNPTKWLPNKLIPTVPIINRGPELLVKASSLSASALVHK